MMNSLVFLEPNYIRAEPFTTSRVISNFTGIAHRKLKVSIRKHKIDIEAFGLLASYGAESSGGRPEESYRLNEQQATFLITLLKNTPVVVEFKKELVRQFYAMRAELMKRQVSRIQLKPIRRSLTDIIQENPDKGKWSYKLYTDLAYKAVLGKTAEQVRKERGAKPKSPAVDFMNSNEIQAVTRVSNQIAVLHEMGMGYEQIRGMLMNQKLVSCTA